MLVVKGLEAFYGRSHVLPDVALEAHAGELVALLGRNGAGKTTLLSALMGVVEHRAGMLAVGGADLGGRGYAPAAAPRPGAGTVRRPGLRQPDRGGEP
jgi:ABC-type branched-subunit amino acid transport system ATPase component